MGYDDVRKADIGRRVRRGASLKDALLIWNRGNEIEFASVKDELDEIRASSWSNDFNSKFRVVCECGYCSPKYRDRYSVCIEGYNYTPERVYSGRDDR